MNDKEKTDIALFRYGIIAPLVTGCNMTDKKRTEFFHDAAQKTYVRPDGSRIKFSSDTIYRYTKLYEEGGFDALKPKGRSDNGKSRKLDDDVISQIDYLHKEYPRLPSTLIYQKLIDNGTITKDSLSLSTVTRYVSNLKKNEHFVLNEYRRYELEHINEVWYGDSSVGPYLKAGKEKKKMWIIALIDDASRFVVGVDIFFNDNFINLMSVIQSAVIKYGKPKTFKFDNGANYRAKQMELLGARLGSAVHYAPAYTPTGKAKVERWFSTLKLAWMAQLNMNDFHSIEEVRDSLIQWTQKYNQTVHSSLNGKSPQERFFEESNLIIRLSDERIEKTFLLEEERTVSADNVISIGNVEYEVDSRYAGRKLLIRYKPDQSKFYAVDRQTDEMEEIHLLDKHKNANHHRKKAYRFSGENS